MAMRVIKAAGPSMPQPENGVARMVAGSMAGSTAPPALGPQPVVHDRMEPGAADLPHDAWEQEIRRREAGAGMAAAASTSAEALKQMSGGIGNNYEVRRAPANMAATDPPNLDGLPTKFTVEVEQKSDGIWKITAPSVHVGLWIADRDLGAALYKVPVALAAILQVDGTKPAARRGRKG